MSYAEVMAEDVAFPTPSTQISTTEISQCYNKCLLSFKSLFALFSHPTNSDLSFENFNVSKGLDQYARLRAWGYESRAVLPAASRGSLDDILRKNATSQPIVTGVLEKIERQIEHGT
jgi:hypothetical protein